MKRASRYLLLQITIACILGTGVFIILPLTSTPLRIDESFQEALLIDTLSVQFADLDSDGRDEQIQNFILPGLNLAVNLVKTNHGGTQGQSNIPLSTQRTSLDFKVGDYDHNDTLEIFFMYQCNDSIFLAVIFPYDTARTHETKRIFVDTLRTIAGSESKICSEPGELTDLNRDGHDEYVFFIKSEYGAYYPRKLYSFYVDSKKIIASDPYGNIINELVVFDLDGDGFQEISGQSHASENNKVGYEYPLTDYSSWLMVFDHNLKLKDNLTSEFPGGFGRVQVFPVQRDEKVELLGYHESNQILEPILLFETDASKKIVFTDTLQRISDQTGYLMYSLNGLNSNGFVSLQGNNYLVFHDERMYPKHIISLAGSGTLFKPLDLNRDGKPEIVINPWQSNKVLIFSTNGKLLAVHQFERLDRISEGRLGTTNFLAGATDYLYVNDSILYFNLITNYWYYLRWLALIGLITFFYVFSSFSMWVQRKQQLRRDAIKQKIRDLELRGIRNQLDPHFTFNALNVLNYLSGTGDNVGVEKFTHHFSRMLRKQLENSDKSSIKLSEELDFIKDYIELQKLRFDIPIHYLEEISPDVDQSLMIPKMLIHTHVENAIKHGLLPKPGGGRIKVGAKSTDAHVVITIEDNGIGRSYGRKMTENSSGKGLQILDQMIDLFYQLYQIRVTQKFVDLKDNNNEPTGTCVVIEITI